jgi:hypothetical protein
MDTHKLCLKLFLENPGAIHRDALVPVFHRWIQARAVPEHLLVDVADYAHVRHGPGVVLVSHEANFSLDAADGRTGLLYQRKQPFPGAADFGGRLAAAFRHALAAAARLEAEPAFEGRAKFKTDEIEFRIADRLHAPGTREAFETVKLELEAFGLKLLGGASFHLQHHADPERPFEVTIQTDGTRSVGDLLARL